MSEKKKKEKNKTSVTTAIITPLLSSSSDLPNENFPLKKKDVEKNIKKYYTSLSVKLQNGTIKLKDFESYVDVSLKKLLFYSDNPKCKNKTLLHILCETHLTCSDARYQLRMMIKWCLENLEKQKNKAKCAELLKVQEDNNDRTPIHIFVYKQHDELGLQCLLDYADESVLNICDLQGNTALHHAAMCAKFNFYHLLKQAGANECIRNKQSKACHDYLIEKTLAQVIPTNTTPRNENGNVSSSSQSTPTPTSISACLITDEMKNMHFKSKASEEFEQSFLKALELRDQESKTENEVLKTSYNINMSAIDIEKDDSGEQREKIDIYIRQQLEYLNEMRKKIKTFKESIDYEFENKKIALEMLERSSIDNLERNLALETKLLAQTKHWNVALQKFTDAEHEHEESIKKKLRHYERDLRKLIEQIVVDCTKKIKIKLPYRRSDLGTVNASAGTINVFTQECIVDDDNNNNEKNNNSNNKSEYVWDSARKMWERNAHLWDSLFEACRTGNVVKLQMYLMIGGDPNLHDKMGKSILEHAVEANQIDCVFLLLHAGIPASGYNQIYAERTDIDESIRMLLADYAYANAHNKSKK